MFELFNFIALITKGYVIVLQADVRVHCNECIFDDVWAGADHLLLLNYKKLRDRELNPGLLRDRQGYLPLYYLGVVSILVFYC